MFLITLALLVLSCATKEEKTLNEMHQLSSKVERTPNDCSDEELMELMEEFGKLSQQAEKCRFNSEQQQEFTLAQYKLTMMFMKKNAKRIGQGVGKMVKDTEEYMEEFYEGFEDGYEEGVGSDLSEVFEELDDLDLDD